MSQFTVRIELHGAVRGDYDLLHERMEAAGYQRFISGISSTGEAGVWHLPTAEYDFSSTADAEAVRAHAKRIADTVKPDSWCLVTQVQARCWHTKQLETV